MADARTTPTEISQAGPGHLRIRWQDGLESSYPVRSLRLSCACARCVEEFTGRPLLLENDVPADVRPLQIRPVGRYAIQISWSDGHDSGIFTFERLRELSGPANEPA